MGPTGFNGVKWSTPGQKGSKRGPKGVQKGSKRGPKGVQKGSSGVLLNLLNCHRISNPLDFKSKFLTCWFSIIHNVNITLQNSFNYNFLAHGFRGILILGLCVGRSKRSDVI